MALSSVSVVANALRLGVGRVAAILTNVPCITTVQGLAALAVFGAIGYLMMRFGWPRAPLVLGFVLGKLAETYLFISMARYGYGLLWAGPAKSSGTVFVQLELGVNFG